MNTILGSQFETSLRILLLLEAVHGEELSEIVIAEIDFITAYSHDFGVTKSNLHGDNKYRFGEFASRRAMVRSAVKQLVLDRLVEVSQTAGGFKYKLSDEGLEFVSALSTEYADAYYETAIQVIAVVGKSERILGEMINRRTIASMREE